MANNISKFILDTVGNLTPLFPFTPSTMKLADCIGLCLNQSLERDGFAGAWASVYTKKNPLPTDSVYVSIVSPDPNADVTGYQTLLKSWLAAVNTACGIYSGLPNKPTDIAFLAPFGLSLVRTQSVQLLHYPPTETLGSMNYLYSPTNRRWETLLAYNGCTGSANKLLETITDLVPVAANGGDTGGKEITNIGSVFNPYVTQMLNVLLRSTNGVTQPVVAYGGPVMEFVGTLAAKISPPATDQSTVTGHPSKTPAPLSLYQLQLITSGPKTAVLCANHPSKFMYYPTQENGEPPTDYNLVMLQDLTAARWQVQMAANPAADPVTTLTNAWNYWSGLQSTPAYKTIFAAQVAEFTEGTAPTAAKPKPSPGKAKPAAKKIAPAKKRR